MDGEILEGGVYSAGLGEGKVTIWRLNLSVSNCFKSHRRMSFAQFKQMFESRKQLDVFLELANLHNEFLSRREKTRPATKSTTGYGTPRRIRENTLTYRQIMLHRSLLLFEGALAAADQKNTYSMVLSIRGHFESAAALGHVHYRLNSLRQGNISAEQFDKGLSEQIMGSGDASLPEAPNPRNILTLLEYADKSINKHIAPGASEPLAVLSEPYNWLCEFCHPNFHSNAVAIEIDNVESVFRFRFDMEMREMEFDIIKNLILSGTAFVGIFDQLPDLLLEVC